MIDHLWRDRLELGDQLITVAAEPKGRFIVACQLEGLRRRAIDAAKWLRPRLKSVVERISTRARAATVG
jgi:hypothetical protein